jgi:hypothetical protein
VWGEDLGRQIDGDFALCTNTVLHMLLQDFATYLLIVEYFWLFKNFMKKKNAIAQCISFMYYSGKIG